MDWKDTLAAAKIKVVKEWPWISSALFNLKPYEKKGVGTFAVTDDGILILDPDKVVEWGVDGTAAALVHEVCHPIRNHGERRELLGADPIPWNLAADAEINDDVVRAWPKLKELFVDPDTGKTGIILPETLGMEDGLTAEEYYPEAKKQEDAANECPDCKREQEEAEKNSGNGEEDEESEGDGDQDGGSGDGGEEDGDGSGGSGQQDGDGDGDGEGQGQGQGSGQGQGQGQGSGGGGGRRCPKHSRGIAGGACGSCAGKANSTEEEARKAVGGGRTKAQMDNVRRAIAEAIQKEAESGRGNIPGGWRRWAEAELKPPKIPWQKKLARACRNAVAKRAGAVDLGYHRPSRRQAGLGYGPGRAVMPHYFSPVPRAMFLVDTSGSMGDDEIVEACSEAAAILKQVGTECQFGSIDAQMQALGKVTHPSQFRGLIQGGGGTDFRPAFEMIRELPPNDRPEILIFATDGCGPAPMSCPPNLHVIWLLVGPYQREPYRCSDEGGWNEEPGGIWGEVISIPNGEDDD